MIGRVLRRLDFELADVSMTVALKRRHGRVWFRHRDEPASRDDARTLMREVFHRWREMMAETSSARVPLGPIEGYSGGSPVRDRAFRLLEAYPVRSFDAAHAATALLVEAPLVCRDVGFASIPAELLTLITDSSRLTACRSARAS